jgi:signal transduction histidine kinase/CheY-like chemotaxis protein
MRPAENYRRRRRARLGTAMTSYAKDTEFSDIEDFADLFENAPCGYLFTSPNGRILKANLTLATWLGRDATQIVGRRIHDFLPIAGKVYFETHFAPLLRMQGFFNEAALELVRADKHRLPVLVNAIERRNDAGDLRFIRITIFNAGDRQRYEDDLLEARTTADKVSADLRELNATLELRVQQEVGERLLAEQALRQAQKLEAIGQLTGGIAHDFNNMLAVVLGGLNLIRRRIARGDTDVDDLIAAVVDRAGKAALLTQRLLAFSRLQPLSPIPLNANKMVSEMSELLRSTLGGVVQMETVLAAGLWNATADQNQLENVILNLSVNARDAMPQGGRLTIDTANCHIDDSYAREHAVPSGQYVMIAVTDTGTGMTPAVIAKAFDPFFTTKEIGQGTGLGLSQVFGFVKQSGGHVKIYSEVGEGTTIKVYLPRYYGTTLAIQRPVPRGIPHGSPDEIILLVEDDDSVRALSSQMLSDLGYSVIAVESGSAALAALDANPSVSLLFTDVVMPDMNGRQLADEVRVLWPALRVLFTTGYTPNAIVHNGVLDSNVTILQKPATLEQLALKVRTVLDS